MTRNNKWENEPLKRRNIKVRATAHSSGRVPEFKPYYYQKRRRRRRNTNGQQCSVFNNFSHQRNAN
jgi:hypothetical protein